MSNSIDELKSGVIDATVPPTEKMDVGVQQLYTQQEALRATMTAPVIGAGGINNGNQREAADLSAFPKQNESETVGVEIHESLAKDILEGPNSAFAQYVEEKKEEMGQRMATLAEEEQLKAEEAELEESESSNSDGDIGFDSALVRDVRVEEPEEKPIANLTATVNHEEVYDTVSKVVKNADEDVSRSDTKEGPGMEAKTPDIQIATIAAENGIEYLGEDEDAEEIQADNTEDALVHLKELITEKLKPAARKLDISSFTVAKKATANISALKQEKERAAKWVLPSSKATVMVKEFSGAELELLRGFSEDNNSMSSLSKKYRMVYDHIVSSKPASFEAWLKTTPFADLDHIFFAIYIACFKDANYLPVDCVDKKCNETWLTENVNFWDMVKFKNDEEKAKFMKIYQAEEQIDFSKGLYLSEITPLNENLAIGFREPSVYSLIELSALDPAFTEKYASIIQFIPYIDALYIIDHDANGEITGNLTPIGYKIYPDNATKSIKSKIQKFSTCLNTLSSDEFAIIKSYIQHIMDFDAGISYLYPSATCPKCGTQVPEHAFTAEQLLFTRYQLGALANTSLK